MTEQDSMLATVKLSDKKNIILNVTFCQTRKSCMVWLRKDDHTVVITYFEGKKTMKEHNTTSN